MSRFRAEGNGEEMKKRKLGKYISIDRTEQWEWAATCGDYSATGSSEQSAELNLLRKITGLSVKTAAAPVE